MKMFGYPSSFVLHVTPGPSNPQELHAMDFRSVLGFRTDVTDFRMKNPHNLPIPIWMSRGLIFVFVGQ
jgi:hypothetical protein